MNTALAFDKLFTSRLLLRRVREDDLPLLVKWSQSEEYCGEYLSPEEFNLNQLSHQVNSGTFWGEDEKLFIIEKKDQKKAIGSIHFWQPAGRADTRVVALKIAEVEERNHGFGTEAQKFLLIYLFDRLGVQRVEMYTDINNIPQQRCLHKLGFELLESLNYDDVKTHRTGNLYGLKRDKYLQEPIFRYHYE